MEFFRSPWLLERFCHVCLLGDAATFADLFKPMDASLAEWRWFSLLSCVSKALDREFPLRAFFDVQKLRFQDADAVDEAGGRTAEQRLSLIHI
eukprot:2076848-Alexandrium_andersonii.AAC.1